MKILSFLRAPLLFALISFAIGLSACQKDISGDPGATDQADLTTKVSASVSGFVTDENDQPVLGATVKVGTITTFTDKYGYFQVGSSDVVKNAAVVTVSRNGYFKGIKTFIATAGKDAFFRIKLLPKTAIGSFSGSTGGTVTSGTGLKIVFPANAIVVAANGAAYTGTVQVSARRIDPVSNELEKIMPGDLRGLDAAGSLKLLTSYGMLAAELTGSGGESLQIATGKKATITLDLDASILATAPASIPLWYFNEANGLWTEEGTALKTGNTYVGEMSHFSYWNCDVPANYVHFSCTVKTSTGAAVSHALVKVSSIANPNNRGFGYTDTAGYTTGAVPNNMALKLEVFSSSNCGTAVYSQTFTTTNVNINLGTITIPVSTNFALVSGTLTNCSGGPVTNGYLIVKENSQFHRFPVNSTGAFSFPYLLCSSSPVVTLIGEDQGTAQQSVPASFTLVAGANAIGNIQACGVSAQQFFNMNINGTAYSFTTPADSIHHGFGSGTAASMRVIAFRLNSNTPSETSLSFASAGVAVNSLQLMEYFRTAYIQDSMTIVNPISVRITELGAIGEFISGNFTGTFRGAMPANISYNVSASFRTRRSN
ncbi:MAG: carboxypeptidase regulatory-like protein [Ferruginibacter sp.]|nr:carboxypeptidase regulatory-like protein [Ferruginibacter sp.]